MFVTLGRVAKVLLGFIRRVAPQEFTNPRRATVRRNPPCRPGKSWITRAASGAEQLTPFGP